MFYQKFLNKKLKIYINGTKILSQTCTYSSGIKKWTQICKVGERNIFTKKWKLHIDGPIENQVSILKPIKIIFWCCKPFLKMSRTKKNQFICNFFLKRWYFACLWIFRHGATKTKRCHSTLCWEIFLNLFVVFD